MILEQQFFITLRHSTGIQILGMNVENDFLISKYRDNENWGHISNSASFRNF